MKAPEFVPEKAVDSRATTEAALIAEGRDLERDGAEREHGRKQAFKDHVNRAAIALFWTLVGCVALGLFVYVWHLLTPADWHFLGEQALNKLETLLGAAILSSALTNYANRQMG